MIEFLIRNFKLSQRIHIGSVLTALIILSIILVFYQGFSSISKNLVSYLEFSDFSNKNLSFVANMHEMQRQALLYTYEGFDESGQQVSLLYAQMIRQLDDNRQTGMEQSADIFEQIENNLKQYAKTFEEVKRQRELQKHLVRTELRQYATEAQQLIEHMIRKVDKNSPELMTSYTQLLNSLLLIEKDAYRYFDSLDASYIDKAMDSIEKTRRNTTILNKTNIPLEHRSDINAGVVDTEQPPENERVILKRLSSVLDQYEQKFIEAVQRTRGYLYLINVVMAAEAYEVLYQSEKLTTLMLAETSRIKTGMLAKSQSTLYRVIFLSVLLLLLAIWFYRLLSQSISLPLNRLTKTFKQLVNGVYDTQIPVYTIQDELGALTLAADSFRKGNLELAEKKDELSNSYEKLHRINADLEKTIELRTDVIRAQNTHLAAAKKKAEKASQAKSQFLANMSHELRTPMHGIIGMAHLAFNSSVDPITQRYIEKIDNSATALLAMINDILDFSKIEAGKQVLVKQLFDLFETIEHVVDLVEMKAYEKKLELIVAYGKGVNRLFYGDSLRLSQMLINLLSNAIKFTEDGFVVLHITRKSENRYQFGVRDTGIGISGQTPEKLFQSFSQADNGDTRKYGGTGLGLTITRQLAELMKGRIWVEPITEGACFVFEIELQEKPDKTNYHQFNDKHLLIMDDCMSARDNLQEMLLQTGVSIAAACNRREGIQFLENLTKSLDIVMVNVSRSVTDNAEQKTLNNIHAICTEKQIRIVLICHSFQLEKAVQITQGMKIDQFLQKPIDPAKLNDILSTIFIKDYENNQRPKVEKRQHLPSIKKLAGNQILLAEDNVTNREITIGLLGGSGIEITVVENGLEAVENFKKNVEKFALVIVDLQMPVMDGFEAARRIRQIDQDVPIIAITANLTKQADEKSKRVGINRYLTKPIKVAEVYSTLLYYLSRETDVPLVKKDAKTKAGIPNFQRLDTESGIKKMGGNQSIYDRILRNFRDDYQQVQLTLLDNEHLIRTVHTLKGLSANIGAFRLFELAKAFETGKDLSMLEAMQSEMNRLLKAINEHCSREKPDNKDKQVIDAAERQQILFQLKVALKNMQAGKCNEIYERLDQYLLDEALLQLLEKLKKYTEKYQYEEAEVLLNHYHE